MSPPVYLGFDLSTQQIKCIAITADLKLVHQAKFEFDADSRGFDINKGVLINAAEGEIFSPVAMWAQALDTVLDRIREDGLNLADVKGISGSGMQHGSVFWNHEAERILASLDGAQSLEAQLAPAYSHPYSPNWQDASTQDQCDKFDRQLGSEEALAACTGSKAHHRFTGPQIMRFRQKYPERYRDTARISLVSSWVASVFLGKVAPFDISDACGMNLRDIRNGRWHAQLLELAAGVEGADDLRRKLGHVPEDGGLIFGTISQYFVQRHGFHPSCKIVASTGDNPSTTLALPLRSNDAIVSLGTSSTFLMVTPEYLPDPSYHFFNSPTTAGQYMFMLCYKNGGLARESVRNDINQQLNKEDKSNTWDHYDKAVLSTPPLAQHQPPDPFSIGLYFPRHEIVPNLPAGEWHYRFDPQTDVLQRARSTPRPPLDDARVIAESQFLSMRLRSRKLVKTPDGKLPPQPRRIYLVGGGSKSRAIAKVCGEVLGGSEGVFKLDVGENACGLGAAHKAVWSCEREPGQGFEEFIESRWDEARFVQKICEGYQPGIFEKYGDALKGFEKMELELLKEAAKIDAKRAVSATRAIA